ncbi:MAG: hypothetical protein ABIL09_13670 [Gemmatimonadota bacterium]
MIDKSLGLQLRQALDLPRVARRVGGRPYEAANVDAWDEVPNSTWFTNRNGRFPMSPDAVHRGPTRGAGPDTTGPWTVVTVKSDGVTPGMIIDDVQGDRYLLKFDPVGFSGLASGADVVGSRLFHAAGYNVPENYVAYLDPDRLVLAEDAMIQESTPDKRPPMRERLLRRQELAAALARVNSEGTPRVRVLASRYLPGKPLGPWPYEGVRDGDANDVYPHEHRREIRGLYVVASWLNHADLKEENTLDMYDPEAGIVIHYLIDFGAALGSNSRRPSNPRRGQANSIDVRDSLVRLATLGLYVHDYERAPCSVPYPAVGYLGNELFQPWAWKPMYPVPAFENLTARDAFWGARIVTSFTEEQIGAAVAAARFDDPEAAAALTRFLVERRDCIGRYWFSRTDPLDAFKLEGERLGFVDLAVARGLAPEGAAAYEYVVYAPSGKVLGRGSVTEPELDLPGDWRRGGGAMVSLQPRRSGLSCAPVLVYLGPGTAEGSWEVIGLRRLD